MVRHIEAIVENGLLRPVEPLNLPEGMRVRIPVIDGSVAAKSGSPAVDYSMVDPDRSAARLALIESFDKLASPSTGRYRSRDELYDRKGIR